MSREKTGDQWTADELLSELRFRERQARATRARSAQPPSLHPELRSIPTAKLLTTLRDRQRVIYGTDNRQDLYQVKKPKVLRAAEAVAALVRAPNLTENPDGTFDLATESYQNEYDLCGDEPFASQPLGCFCSGFLVGKDVIATAGHCVKSAADLAKIRFVFGFRMLDSTTARTVFPAADVYSGASIIGRRMVGDGPDWALVRLDRLVMNRRPVTVRTAGKIASGQSLFVIGHPNGLPAKFAPGAKVRDNSPVPFFVANLDTYGGNSGSPVFNRTTLQVEGILVRGENDFVSNGTCNLSLVCPNTGCRGEDVTRSSEWAGKIPKSRPGGRRTARSAKGARTGRKGGSRRRA